MSRLSNNNMHCVCAQLFTHRYRLRQDCVRNELYSLGWTVIGHFMYVILIFEKKFLIQIMALIMDTINDTKSHKTMQHTKIKDLRRYWVIIKGVTNNSHDDNAEVEHVEWFPK